jgi:hypothetical protein
MAALKAAKKATTPPSTFAFAIFCYSDDKKEGWPAARNAWHARSLVIGPA